MLDANFIESSDDLLADLNAKKLSKMNSEPPLVSHKYIWTDITESFKNACKNLKLGQLLHDANFSLMEGMSAIEMMDPKMDAGMMCNQSKRKLVSLVQAIADGELKVDNFTSEELIGIIDDTLACFTTWLEGHSLAQTVFINLYLHNPSLINDPTNKSFTICMLKIIDDVREKINRVSVYEEEDFQSMTYNFNMAEEISDQVVSTMMKEVEEDYFKVVKSTRARTGVEQTQDDLNKHTLAQGLASRMKFVRLFYTFLTSLNREKGMNILDSEKYLKQMTELLVIIKSTVYLGSFNSSEQRMEHKSNSSNGLHHEINSEYIDNSKNIVDYNGQESHHLTSETTPQQLEHMSHKSQQHQSSSLNHEKETNHSNHEQSRIFAPGFEPLANQRLLPPTFPRHVSIRSRLESVEYLQQLITRLQNIIAVSSLTNFHEIIDFCLEFSKSSPCILSRSLLQLMILPINKRVFGKELIMDMIKETIRSFCSPPVLIKGNALYNNLQLKEYLDTFIMHCVRPIMNIVQTTGHNRARMRDRWARVGEELALLQDEAEKLDSYMHKLMMKIDTNYRMGSYFGLELELYAPHEYNYVFWYLSEGLYNWLTSTLNRAETYVHEAEAAGVKGSKKVKKTKKKARLPSNELFVSQALHCLTGGYYKAVIALKMDNKLSVPKFDFDSEEVRYSHRFAPFSFIIAPPPLQYHQFKEHTDVTLCEPSATPCDLYKGASKCFNQAKMHLEGISTSNDEIQNLLKVAKTNLVVMRILEGGHQMDNKKLPEFNFEQHKLFPIIKLT